MQLYLVTGLATEQTSAGIIQRVDSIVYGVFTREEQAEGIAEKYNGNVKEITWDMESRRVVENWVNPGYFADS